MKVDLPHKSHGHLHYWPKTLARLVRLDNNTRACRNLAPISRMFSRSFWDCWHNIWFLRLGLWKKYIFIIWTWFFKENSPYVLWKLAISLKFPNTSSLQSRIFFGIFKFGLSMVFMYRSTTCCKSLPNSSSVSTSSRTTALEKIVLVYLKFLPSGII